MSIESAVRFERDVEGEEALVLRDGLDNLNNPKLVALLEKLDNFPVELLERLLKLDFTPTVGPEEKELVENGVKIEDILSRKVKTPVFGEIEVSDIDRYPVPREAGLGFHLKQKDFRGFEIIYVLDGEATISIPEVEQVALGVYKRSGEMTDVLLRRGDLAVLPAPVANDWTRIGKNFRFRYIGLPPWSPEIVAETFPA